MERQGGGHFYGLYRRKFRSPIGSLPAAVFCGRLCRMSATSLTVTTGSNRPSTGRLAAILWRRFEWSEVALEQIAMGSFIHDAWDGAAQMPSQTWHWFMNLNREEWTVTLAVVCAIGFVALLGFQSRRI